MNAQLASNQSSSLLSTISSSQNVMTNPYVYNQSGNVSVFTSSQTIKVSSSSGAPTANSTINFDLPKMGLIGKTILAIPFYATKTTTSGSTNDAVIVGNWALNAINAVELSSQGRVVSRLDRSAIMARIGERPNYTKEGMNEAMALSNSPTNSNNVFGLGGKTELKWVYLNLDFAYTADTQYSIDTLFVQNCRVSVSFGDLMSLQVGSTATDSVAFEAPYLYCEYKNQSQVDSDALVSANYSSGLLSTILPTMVSEAVVYSTLEAMETGANAKTTSTTLTCNLKETSCVEGIYVMLMIDPQDAGTASAQAARKHIGMPLQITGNISFESNGQKWVDLPAELIGYFGHPENQSGRNGYSKCQVQTAIATSNSTVGALQYVYYISFAQGGLTTSNVSGLLSLRELSNPTISCTIDSNADIAGLRCGLRIVYPTRQLATVVSSSGAYTIALSN